MIGTLGVVWGASFMFIELALTGMTPYWLAASRILLASVVTTLIWQLRGGTLFLTDAPPNWRLVTAIGVVSTALPFMLLSWGQQFVTAGYAGVTMGAMPLMVLGLAHLFVAGEQLTRRKALGMSVGFLGVVVLIGPRAFESSGLEGETLGRLACLGAACCYAASSILTRRLQPVDPIGLSAVTLWIGAVLSTGAAIAVEGAPPLPTGIALTAIVILGLVQTAMANLLRILVIRSAGPTFMSLVNYQVPVWSVIFGVVFLGEALEASLFAALALILTGIAVSQWGALSRLFTRTER
ncbi:MAG: DMT family transporter [Paracoccaceae bacterium]|nr:DMT family transporter [Paracoccaceae bacterium]